MKNVVGQAHSDHWQVATIFIPVGNVAKNGQDEQVKGDKC